MTSDRKADKADNVEIVAGQDTLLDFDMSRREYVDALPADQRRQLEELKRRNSEAMKANDVIRGLNADLMIVTQDLKDADSASDAETKAAKYGEVEALMLRDTQAKPDASILWAQLGQAQLGLMKFREAESSFTKALEVESASTRPNPQIQNLANTKLAQIHAMAGVSAKTNVAPPVPNQPAQESAPPASAQHQYQDIAPPPPPPAPAPTISMGQSKSQVIAAFGEPQRKAAAGPKEIFFYTDLKMKVTFTNGKVSSIE
jgi:tetratricopeptide (TPR) repeat protein